jgi:hypothetical protein
MPAKTISINRAPVLTHWADVVAQRLGFREDEALTLGKALAGVKAWGAKGSKCQTSVSMKEKRGTCVPR